MIWSASRDHGSARPEPRSATTTPFCRDQSPILCVETPIGALEVRRQRWRSARTQRFHTVWTARRPGRLDWHASRDLAEALKSAAGLPAHRRAAWTRHVTAEIRYQINSRR